MILTQAFVSTFLSPFHPNHLYPHHHFILRSKTPTAHVHSNHHQQYHTPTASTSSPSPFSTLSALAASLTALSLLLRPIPTQARSPQPSQASITASASYSTHSPTLNSTLLIRPISPPPTNTSLTSSAPTGTLLQLEPDPTYNPQSERSDTTDSHLSHPSNRSHNPATYPPSPSALPELAAATRLRQVLTPDKLIRFRTRVRPAATLGLVGVGALTSGSVFWRRAVMKRDGERGGMLTDGSNEESVYCSVVCLQIPFCVPERGKLLKGLAELADDACLDNAGGMAKAARHASQLLLEESGLLEDSSKFAPYMDVFVAESLREAERRFSAHVEIEAQRIQKLADKKQVQDVSSTARLGEYGVVTLVIASTEGVNLECYNCDATVIRRLRRALDSVGKLGEGEVAGMELMWVPETTENRSLTRAQLAMAFPTLRIK